jgi:hypothetical protein
MCAAQVKIQSMISWNYVFRSEETGKTYRFSPGQTLNVDVIDSPSLLAKHIPGGVGCCGSRVKDDYYLFQEVTSWP